MNRLRGSESVFGILARAGAVIIVWLALASAVSVACMLAFTWFFLPPTHTFQLKDGANWAVLAVYLSTAVVVSALAAQARRRAELAEAREREASRRAAAELEAEAFRRSDSLKT